MPNLNARDPKSLQSLLETFGTLDIRIDPDEISELLEQADEEIREAEYDLAGGFPNGGLKSAETATLKMGLALALGYCRRLAVGDEDDSKKGARSHRNAALLLWFWAREKMPQAVAVTEHLVDVIQKRNGYNYRGHIVTKSEATDFAASVKEVRAALGDEPIRIYEDLMAQLREAQTKAAKSKP